MANSNLIQRHPFHLVDQSPWPFVAGMSCLKFNNWVRNVHALLSRRFLCF